MVSSNSNKVFFISFLVLTLFSACGWWQKAETQTPSQTSFVAEEIKNGFPFTTNEPEQFQTEFVVSTGDKVEKTFVSRVGEKRRSDYHYGQKNQISVVQTADNKHFLMFIDKKVYAETSKNTTFETAENPFDFLTTEWLNQKTESKFESLGAENNAKKYRVTLDDSQIAESIIWIDEVLNLPVKQEFYSINGEQKILGFTFEMKNFSTEVDAVLFEIPKEFRKVSIEDFHRILKSNN